MASSSATISSRTFLWHISDVMEFMGDQLEVGQRVTFELGQDPKSGKTKAVNVRIS
jgi:cold shock CspA family protein